jgi:trk system potassium uptake protein TrkH
MVAFLGAELHTWVLGTLGGLEPADAVRLIDTYAAAVLAAAALLLTLRLHQAEVVLDRLRLQPLQTVALSFALAILGGTLALSLPMSLRAEERASVWDALFQSTSAVCVTGLSVVSVAEHYTRFGQVVLLLLIQAGGLGIMSLYALVAAAATPSLRSRDQAAFGAALGLERHGALRETLTIIAAATLAIEIAGAALLYPEMRRTRPHDALWQALFHSVSAFCNAGFSTFDPGAETFRDRPATILILSALIVAGGIGYPVLTSALPGARSRGPAHRLHVKLTLTATATLLAAGTILFVGLEWSRSLAPFRGIHVLTNGVFQSVSARTAGFNTISMDAIGPAGASLLMILMLCGASPASTGGGLKTTTIAVVFLTLVAVLRRRGEVRAFHRTVATEDVLRAAAMVVASMAVLGPAVVALLSLEQQPPLAIAFEAVSAFTTTGLSLGITPEVSRPGRMILIVLMFVGRIGPLALLAAFFERRDPGRFRYPQERILFG